MNLWVRVQYFACVDGPRTSLQNPRNCGWADDAVPKKRRTAMSDRRSDLGLGPMVSRIQGKGVQDFQGSDTNIPHTLNPRGAYNLFYKYID